MPLIFLVHNDYRFLRSFFAHYRGMGVTRFICVDDGSTDGTREFLLDQVDTDIYTSNVRYKDADRGKIWREMLLSVYGLDRWYLIVDSDEYFLYESFGRESVLDYARRLDAQRIRRVPAPMLDFYPVGDLSTAIFDGGEAIMPWHVATHFDADGYTGTIMGSGISLYGGVRSRAFKANSELMKYPLIRWDRHCSMGRTIHRPRPAYYNFPPVMGALLHFKIFSDLKEMSVKAIDEGQHYTDAKVYKAMLKRIETSGSFDLAYAGSIPYRGVDDLIDRGFMVALKDFQ